jgi:hypothetical protein
MMGAANDSIMGESPSAGTPFKLQELVTRESHSLHEYRRGQYAKDVERIYKNYIIPYIKKEISKGQRFLSSLSVDEMQYMVEKFSKMRVNKMYADGLISIDDVPVKLEEVKRELMKDNRKFIEIVKDDVKNLPLSVNINVAGKQKNMAQYTDKLVNIFRQIGSAPQMLNDPRLAKLFNQILESSGLEPMDFSVYTAPQGPNMGQPQQLAYADGQNTLGGGGSGDPAISQ